MKAESIKQKFEEINQRVALKQGRIFSLILIPLIGLILFVDFTQTGSVYILQWGGLCLFPFILFLFVSEWIFGHKPKWIPWMFAGCLFMGIFHFLGLAIAVFGGMIQNAMYEDQFSIGIAAAIFSAAIFSKGIRIQLICAFTLLIVVFNVGFYLFIPEFIRFQLILNGMFLLAIVSVYQAYQRDWNLHHSMEQLMARERTLQQKNQSLDMLNRHLESYNYSISHDLKAPLRQARGFVNLLEKELKPQSNENIDEYLFYIQKSLGSMTSLIDAFVSYAKISMVNIAYDFLNMEVMVSDLIDGLKGEETEKGLPHQFLVGDLPKIPGDRALIKQLWYCLLSNAVKFSAGKPNPVIEIGSSEEGTYILYFIKDNGIGFDQQSQDKIFELFQKLHPQGKFKGEGVGLALASKIVQAHRGEIWCQASPEEGATFFFKLPNFFPAD